MSADSWDVCPRCLDSARTEHVRLLKQVEESYGKIPVAEFNALQEQAAREIDVGQTLREDYEFICNIAESRIDAHYSAHCMGCGFAVCFHHQHPYTI